MLASFSIGFLLFTLVKGSPSLSLSVSGPKDVQGVDNFIVTATLTNTGNQTLKLLNDPRGPLSRMPTNTFNISPNPDFNGVKVKYSLDKVVQMKDESLFTTLQPGQSVSVDHDLSSAYNFTRSGEGAYAVSSRNKFHYVHPETNKLVAIEAATNTTAAKVHSLVGKLAVSRHTYTTPITVVDGGTLSKRTGFSGCNDAQVQQVFQAIPVTQQYVSSALRYLQQLQSNQSPRYTTWFGEFDEDRLQTVTQHYTRLTQNDYTSYTYNCNCDQKGVYAFVEPDVFGVVHLCDAFWDAPVSGTDSKGGTIVHESTHFTKNAGTQDNAYGHDNCKALAESDPDEAIMNADTHEYFAENDGPKLA